jgi:hypothetical protein
LIEIKFCELKHLSSIVNIESNEIMKLTASEIIIKIFNIFFVLLDNCTVKKGIPLPIN